MSKNGKFNKIFFFIYYYYFNYPTMYYTIEDVKAAHREYLGTEAPLEFLEAWKSPYVRHLVMLYKREFKAPK